MSQATISEGYIPVTGGRVWYRIVGTGPGIPMLTLHGGPGASSAYLQPLAALADERPVIFYDQLGGGKSDHPDDVTLWTLERFVEEFAQVRAVLGLTQVHIYGHSWGTMLAVAYTLRQPSGLVSLILSGPWLSAPRYVQDANALRRELPVEMQAAIEQYESDGTADSPEYQAASVEWMRQRVCRNETALEGILQGFGDPVTGINAQVYNTMQGPSEFIVTGSLKHVDLTAKLHEIKVPTLFTCGRYDECTPETTAWFQGLLPGSEMVVFEHSAHMTHLEEPESYVQTARAFLRRAESRSAVSSC
jgi:proline iminopeptidase